MTTSRRDFIKTAGVAAGAVALTSALPSWISDVDAAEAAAAEAVDKNALADIALSTARRLGVTYADIRINRYRKESISTREQQVQNVSRSQNFGFGVRVLFKGTWGFASSRDVSPDEVRRITQQAVEIARANSVYQRKRIAMVPATKVVAKWKSAFRKGSVRGVDRRQDSVSPVAKRTGDEDPGRQFRQFIDGMGERAEVLRVNRRLADRTVHHSR